MAAVDEVRTLGRARRPGRRDAAAGAAPRRRHGGARAGRQRRVRHGQHRDHERARARRSRRRRARGAVLVGGLGLGYTAAAVLDLQPGPRRVDVVELDAAPGRLGTAGRHAAAGAGRARPAHPAARRRRRRRAARRAALPPARGTPSCSTSTTAPTSSSTPRNAALYEDAGLAAAVRPADARAACWPCGARARRRSCSPGCAGWTGRLASTATPSSARAAASPTWC